MKKVLNLLVVLLLTIPTIALADMGMPEFREYDAVIVNSEGANCYDYDYKEVLFVVPTDTKIKVTYEYKAETDTFAYTQIDYNQEFCNISIKDIAPIEKNFNPSDYTKTNRKYYVISDDLYLKKGPAEAYKNATSSPIPIGTILTSRYLSDDIWEYVSYDGYAGWIETSNMYDDVKVANYSDKALSLLNYKEGVRLYSRLDSDEPLNVSIPSGTKLSYKAYLSGKGYLVTYNNVQGWFKHDDTNLMIQNDSTMLILDSSRIILYDKPFSLGSKVNNIEISDFDELKVEYSGQSQTNDLISDTWFAVKIHGQILYINAKYGDDTSSKPIPFLLNTVFYNYYYTKTDFEAYKDYRDLKTKEKYKGDVYLQSKYIIMNDTRRYAFVKGIGFIDITYDTSKFEEVSESNIPNDATIYGLNPGEKITTTVQTTTKAETKPNKKSSVKFMFIGIISGIVVLSLTVLVIIVLINKKKKKKNKESKEEIVTNQEVVTNVEGKTTDEIK